MNKLFTCVATLLAVVLTTPAALAEKTHDLTIQTIFQAGSVNQESIERFADNANRMSGGRLNIDIRPIGSVVGYTETVDAASVGILDGHISFPGYFSGIEPGFAAIADLPGGYDNPYQAQMMMEYGGGLDLLRQMYAKLSMYTIGTTWWGVESMPVNSEVKGVDGFKGLKIRAPQGMASIIFTNLGASAVNLPGSEVYGAFEKGVIDATDWGTLAMNEDAGLHDVATGFIYPGIHSMPMADISIAMERWNALSPELQKILQVATRDLARDMIQSNSLRDTQALKALADKGTEQYEWSDQERQKFRRAAAKVWKEYADKSEFAGEAIGLQLDFLRDHGFLK